MIMHAPKISAKMKVWSLLLHSLQLILGRAEMSDRVSLEPNNCICPSQNYTCQADGVIRMQWESDAFPPGDRIQYSLVDIEDRRETEVEIERDGVFHVKFIRSMVVDGVANISSILLITNLTALNETNITCEISAGVNKDDEIDTNVCIIGPASSPTNLSLTCDSSLVVVSFQPPVYGAECVDYYTVTAISEERNVMCSAATNKFLHNFTLPNDTNVNDYTFTVHSVTKGIDGTFYNGSIASDCCTPSPEGVKVISKTCGLQHQPNISWQGSEMMLAIEEITVRWHRVQSSEEDIHYESASTEEFHLLNLNYSVTGLLEIAITFSSGACEKSSVIEYYVKDVLINVSFSSTEKILLILSRDCIASPENYIIVVTFIEALKRLEQEPHVISQSFSSTVTVVLDMEEELIPDILYNVSVEIVETTSGTVIDEMITTIRTPQEPDIGGAGPSQNGRNIDIIVGVCTFLVVLVVCISVVLVMVLIIRKKKQSQQLVGGRDINAIETEITTINCNARNETAVVYDTPSDLIPYRGPDTSENVAYGVSKGVLTSPNPAYDVV